MAALQEGTGDQAPINPDLAMAVADVLRVSGEVHAALLASPEQVAGYLATDLARGDFLTDGETSVPVDQARIVLRALEIHASGIRDDSAANRTTFAAYFGSLLDFMTTGQPRPEPGER